jgi:predicted dehydrogenase
MASSASAPLRLGILGAARIARLFSAGVKSSSKVVVAAVASRDEEKARTFAREIGAPCAHSSYEAMLADPAIDAVYIPLPNTLHAPWSIRAAEAGKHVLCEKPLAASAAEARAMFDAAQSNRVYLVEAYPYRAQPQTMKLREMLAAGAIGRVQTIQASFGFPLADAANIRFDPALAGGSLLDAGSYPVSLVRMIAGERPRRAHASALWADSGVDRTLVGSLEFPSGVMAQIACSFGTARHRRALIVGDGGCIETTFLNDTSGTLPPLLRLQRGTGWELTEETIRTAAINGFLAEAEAFHDLVRHGWESWSGATPQESIDIMLTLDALAASARSGIPVEITG